MNSLTGKEMTDRIIRSLILLVFGLIYLFLVAVTFIAEIDLAANKDMQYILHITVIFSAFAYLFFIDMIYRTENDNVNGRMSFVFSCLFTVPIIIGRGLGLFSISQNGLNAVYDIFNFYNNISISRTIEIISWTTFFPLSILFLARIFNKSKERADKILAGLCMLSSVCCFIGFMTIISSNTVYLWFGLTGWGVLFVLIIIFYIYSHILKNKADHTS